MRVCVSNVTLVCCVIAHVPVSSPFYMFSHGGSHLTKDSVRSFNGCHKEIFGKVVAAVLYFTPGYESTPKNDLPPDFLIVDVILDQCIL